MIKYIAPAAVIAAAYVVYTVSKASESVKETITQDLNPASADNIINAGIITPIVEASTDGEHDSLASWLYCKFNPNSTLCNKKAALLNSSFDTSQLSGDQIDYLYEQEKEFLTNTDIE